MSEIASPRAGTGIAPGPVRPHTTQDVDAGITAAYPMPVSDSAAPRISILIVEDDAAIADVLEEVLRDVGFSVAVVSTGGDALAAMLNHRPDLVLLDLTLPDMDGLDVCRQLRADPRWNATPVIALTARDRLDDRVIGLREGLDDYVTKPFNITELTARVDANLRRSQREIHLSPLTLLPGNRAIEMALAQRLAANADFAVCYLDIKNFKPYNDRYGFAGGDRIIRGLADIIQAGVAETRHGFPGHIGGDDFVAVVDPDEAQPFCEHVIAAFDRLITSAYTPDDLARGTIIAEDRTGTVRTFPLIALSIAVVVQTEKRYSHIGELSRAAAEIKAFLKYQDGSHYMIERRER